MTGKSGETGRKAAVSVCDAAVFGVAACARAEAAAAAAGLLRVVEVRLFFNVQRDEDFARLDAAARAGEVRAATDFGRLFCAVAGTGRAGGGVVRLETVADFEAARGAAA